MREQIFESTFKLIKKVQTKTTTRLVLSSNIGKLRFETDPQTAKEFIIGHEYDISILEQ